jgi:hypothetical protein
MHPGTCLEPVGGLVPEGDGRTAGSVNAVLCIPASLRATLLSPACTGFPTVLQSCCVSCRARDAVINVLSQYLTKGSRTLEVLSARAQPIGRHPPATAGSKQ